MRPWESVVLKETNVPILSPFVITCQNSTHTHPFAMFPMNSHTHTSIHILTVKRILANHLLSVFVFVVNGFNKHTKSTNIRFKGLSLFLRWTLTMSSRADGWAFVMLAWVRKTHALLWFATTQAGATTTITTSLLHNIKFALHATLNNKKKLSKK